MRPSPLVSLALLVLLCLARHTSPARATGFARAESGGASIVAQELPVGGARTAAAAVAPARFDLVGFHWQGSGSVLFRTRSVGGRWSSWRPVAPEGEDRPDPGSAESRARRGWRLGNPYWVGPSDRVDYRVLGAVRRLRAWYVWSPPERSTLRAVAMAGSPAIVSRAAWGADEEIVRARPRYAKTLAFAVVHHTAGSNDYGPDASAAIVRAIELYHVRANGWSDIGYNFLVDRFGRIFEGRAGGIDRNVIGAHAEGFNTGSVGIALIGNYTSRSVPAPAMRALARLLAWRLDVAHVDPLGFVTWISGGNPKYPRGTPVLLRVISGHRDTGFTTCPGGALYRRLPSLAHRVAAIGLPKLYAPAVQGTLGGRVLITARLSSPRPWTVTIRSASGALVARGSGSGVQVSWAWDSAGATPGRYTWTIEAGAATRPAQGVIGGSAPPPPPPPPASLLSALRLEPTVLSPDGDGLADVTTVSYTLAAKSAVTATVADAGGATVATLFSGQLQSARRQSFPFDPAALPDGVYVLTVAAVAEDGRTARLSAGFSVDRTLSALALSTPVLSPNGDGSNDTLGISFALATASQVTVQVEQAGAVVATLFAGLLPAGPAQLSWDGTAPGGSAPDGAYQVDVVVEGPFGETQHVAAFTIQH